MHQTQTDPSDVYKFPDNVNISVGIFFFCCCLFFPVSNSTERIFFPKIMFKNNKLVYGTNQCHADFQFIKKNQVTQQQWLYLKPDWDQSDKWTLKTVHFITVLVWSPFHTLKNNEISRMLILPKNLAAMTGFCTTKVIHRKCDTASSQPIS